jgi:hypothetical protein
MAWTYETVNPSPIANTIVEKGLSNGTHLIYRVRPIEGYVLHDNRVDETVMNPETLEPTGEIILRYATGLLTVRHDYDFDNIVPDTITDVNGNVIAVNKVGAFELFAVLASAVPENNIYGGGNNEHEVM